MNLALLNPFRQADRIDSTLTIPRSLHPPRPKKDAVSSSATTANDTTAKTKSDAKKATLTSPLGSPFKIPKKQKLNNGSTKLFRQSLKLPKLSKGEKEDMEVDGNGIDANKTNKKLEDDKDSMMDIEMKGSSETMTGGDKGKSQDDKEGDTVAVTTPKQKKKRKKKGSQKQSAKDNASSEEDDDDDDDSENYWTACYAVSFNRRGSNLASGHASGLIPIHDFSGRTMSALYWPPPGINLVNGKNNASASLQSFIYSDGGSGKDHGGKRGEKESGKKKKGKMKKKKEKGNSNNQEEKIVQISSDGDLLVGAALKLKEESTSTAAAVDAVNDDVIGDKDGSKDEVSDNQLQYMNGVTSLSWCRHSRTLLAGAIGDNNLRLMDNTHPLVSTDCTDAMRRLYLAESGSKDVIGDNETQSTLEEKKASIISMSPPLVTTLPSPPLDNKERSGNLSASSITNSSPKEKNSGERITIRLETVSLGRARLLRSNIVDMRKSKSSSSNLSSYSTFSSEGCLLASTAQTDKYTINVPTRRHPTLLLELPQPLGGPVQLHPRDSHAGLACMIDGSLALFWMPPMAFYETLHFPVGDGNETDSVFKKTDIDDDDEQKKKRVMDLLKEEELSRVGNLVFLVPSPEKKLSTANQSSPKYFITCAAFGKRGDVLWAVTKCGNLLAFCIDQSMMNMLRGISAPPAAVAFANQMVKPALCVSVPGGAAAWQIIVSRNGKSLLINSADCSLRLYDVEELSEAFKTPSSEMKGRVDSQSNDDNYTRNADIAPSFVFQDNISKAPWASCDFSGDGEYVCGGCNSYPQPGDNYKLFLWNCITGELVDQLTGPVSSLYSLSCHPTRPFIAVGTSDGLVDVWGARLDWVAFAPDFQALQQNELYEEREDEFDVVVDGKGEEEDYGKEGSVFSRLSPEDDDVDVVNLHKVPAFDSDSEDESDVFHFDTKVDKIMTEKQSQQPVPKKAELE